MEYYLGIDLGSTTSKAVMVDETGGIVGRGITNTRANYEVAAEIARKGAEYDTRFSLLGNRYSNTKVLKEIEIAFRYLRFSRRFDLLASKMTALAEERGNQLPDTLKKVFGRMRDGIKSEFFSHDVSSTSQFFRDIFLSHYLQSIESLDGDMFDSLLALYDASVLAIENQVLEFDFPDMAMKARKMVADDNLVDFEVAVDAAAGVDLTPRDYVGTGYGRQLLPFDKEHIKSEILCHAFGAHSFFPGTRTVLDIGGQDTKAIQVDEHGLVTSFQMNDRCAAGCGRYLGYIADELNVSVSDLGPLALGSDYETNICSTCTVFAGAELREYLNLGEKRENILAGLHEAIVLRAFSLLARSGGVKNEFTFTGGVARNAAVVKYVSRMVKENYGAPTTNIHPDSIFMGALGAALLGMNRR